MNKIIAALVLGAILMPASVMAQVKEQPTQEQITYQLIALLTEQVKILQAQLAELIANQNMAYEQLEREDPEPYFEIRPSGNKFEVWSNVPGNAESITISIPGEQPGYVVLKAELTAKDSELRLRMDKDGNEKYSLDLRNRLEGETKYKGHFEVVFPEDFTRAVDYSVVYEEADVYITADLHKNATTNPDEE